MVLSGSRARFGEARVLCDDNSVSLHFKHKLKYYLMGFLMVVTYGFIWETLVTSFETALVSSIALMQ